MTRKGRLQPAALAAILAVQGVAAVFFVGDALADLQADLMAPHSVFEALVVVALVLGMGAGVWQLRSLLTGCMCRNGRWRPRGARWRR